MRGGERDPGKRKETGGRNKRQGQPSLGQAETGGLWSIEMARERAMEREGAKRERALGKLSKDKERMKRRRGKKN